MNKDLLKFSNKGITLVALVITIILLLILAGITISSLTGSGLFENAKLAEEKSKNAQEKEEGILADYENKVGQYVDGSRDTETIESLKSEIENLKNQILILSKEKADLAETSLDLNNLSLVTSLETTTSARTGDKSASFTAEANKIYYIMGFYSFTGTSSSLASSTIETFDIGEYATFPTTVTVLGKKKYIAKIKSTEDGTITINFNTHYDDHSTHRSRLFLYVYE